MGYVYRISLTSSIAFVDSLDLIELGFKHVELSPTGRPPYDPADAIKKVFKEFIYLCKKLDLFGGELVAIDGSKFKAVNSKKRNFNEAKLKKLYKTEKCSSCEFRPGCTSHKRGRIVTRRKYEDILQENRKRIKDNMGMVNKRKELVEYPFGYHSCL